jgi:hypothetical protein
MGQNTSISTVVMILAIAAVLAAIATRGGKAPITNDPRVAYRGDISLTLGSHAFEGSVRHVPGFTRIDFHIGKVPVAALTKEKANDVRILRLNRRRMVLLDRQTTYRPIKFLREIVDLWDRDAELIGTETIDGQLIKKYRIDGSHGRYEMWFTKQGIVTRLVGEDEDGGKPLKVDYRLYNLQFGALERKAFRVPRGYLKVSTVAKLVR